MGWERPTPPRPSATRATDVKCANCKMPIDHEPVVEDGHTFCCEGCADGGPCIC